jgi:hypothetical protein
MMDPKTLAAIAGRTVECKSPSLILSLMQLLVNLGEATAAIEYLLRTTAGSSWLQKS